MDTTVFGSVTETWLWVLFKIAALLWVIFLAKWWITGGAWRG